MKKVFAALATGALSVLIAAGCAGGDKAAPGGGAAKPSSNQEELVSADFLADVARNTDAVTSLSGEFAMDFEMGDVSFAMSGDMALEDGVMHMDMRMSGQRFQMLMTADGIYMNVPGEGWFVFDPEAIGVDADAFGQYFENKGIVDMGALSEALDELEQLPNDDIDGRTYAHYRGSYDVAEALANQETAGLLNAAGQEAAEGMTGTSGVDMWIDGESMLPRRVTVEGDMFMPAIGQDVKMTMTMDFLTYNEDVDVPEVPTDARDFSELGP